MYDDDGVGIWTCRTEGNGYGNISFFGRSSEGGWSNNCERRILDVGLENYVFVGGGCAPVASINFTY